MDNKAFYGMTLQTRCSWVWKMAQNEAPFDATLDQRQSDTLDGMHDALARGVYIVADDTDPKYVENLLKQAEVLGMLTSVDWNGYEEARLDDAFRMADEKEDEILKLVAECKIIFTE